MAQVKFDFGDVSPAGARIPFPKSEWCELVITEVEDGKSQAGLSAPDIFYVTVRPTPGHLKDHPQDVGTGHRGRYSYTKTDKDGKVAYGYQLTMNLFMGAYKVDQDQLRNIAAQRELDPANPDQNRGGLVGRVVYAHCKAQARTDRDDPNKKYDEVTIYPTQAAWAIARDANKAVGATLGSSNNGAALGNGAALNSPNGSNGSLATESAPTALGGAGGLDLPGLPPLA